MDKIPAKKDLAKRAQEFLDRLTIEDLPTPVRALPDKSQIQKNKIDELIQRAEELANGQGSEAMILSLARLVLELAKELKATQESIESVGSHFQPMV